MTTVAHVVEHRCSTSPTIFCHTAARAKPSGRSEGSSVDSASTMRSTRKVRWPGRCRRPDTRCRPCRRGPTGRPAAGCALGPCCCRSGGLAGGARSLPAGGLPAEEGDGRARPSRAGSTIGAAAAASASARKVCGSARTSLRSAARAPGDLAAAGPTSRNSPCASLADSPLSPCGLPRRATSRRRVRAAATPGCLPPTAPDRSERWRPTRAPRGIERLGRCGPGARQRRVRAAATPGCLPPTAPDRSERWRPTRAPRGIEQLVLAGAALGRGSARGIRRGRELRHRRHVRVGRLLLELEQLLEGNATPSRPTCIDNHRLSRPCTQRQRLTVAEATKNRR
jgi:hypothetical protein